MEGTLPFLLNPLRSVVWSNSPRYSGRKVGILSQGCKAWGPLSAAFRPCLHGWPLPPSPWLPRGPLTNALELPPRLTPRLHWDAAALFPGNPCSPKLYFLLAFLPPFRPGPPSFSTSACFLMPLCYHGLFFPPSFLSTCSLSLGDHIHFRALE